MVFGELSHDIPVIKDMATYFVIEPEGEKSKLTIEVHPQNPPFFTKIALFFMKGFMLRSMKKLIARLKTAVEKENFIMQLPDSQIQHSEV